MPEGGSLDSRLADVLPKDWKASIYHVSSAPAATAPILAAPPNRKEQATFRQSHFLAVASSPAGTTDGVLIYAIEVLIFATASLTTVFVSKADSSGFRPQLDAGAAPHSGSIVQSVTHVFLDYLLGPCLEKAKVVVSLFARSQHQYLFPGSIENADKHVLDDRQLIKWWCKILDRLWRPYDQSTATAADKSHNVTAYLVVPGCDKAETRFFFPASTRSDPPEHPKWLNSYPEGFITDEAGLPPRCAVPRLPDDPKSRFLDDLDGDYVGPDGQWRSVKSLPQFWEMMAYRQECHAGSLVGFVWITFKRESPSAIGHTANASSSTEPSSTSELLECKQQHTDVPVTPGTNSATHNATPKGSVVLTPEAYDEALDFLLHLDFAGVDTAAESTRKWVNKVIELAASADFGHTVVGTHVSGGTHGEVAPVSVPEANLLTGLVRKKRKAEVEPAPSTQLEPNILSSGLIRKKPKKEPSS